MKFKIELVKTETWHASLLLEASNETEAMEKASRLIEEEGILDYGDDDLPPGVEVEYEETWENDAPWEVADTKPEVISES